MPGMFPGREGIGERIVPAGPVALHPVAVVTFEALTERWSVQRRSDAIVRVFGCSVTHYMQYLNREVLGDETAAAIAPAVIERLVAERDERRALRVGVSA